MIIEIKDNQNLKDLVLQYTGSTDVVVQVAFANGMSVSSMVSKGSKIIIPDEIMSGLSREHKRLIELYRVNQKNVATGIFEDSDSFEGDFDENDFDDNDFSV